MAGFFETQILRFVCDNVCICIAYSHVKPEGFLSEIWRGGVCEFPAVSQVSLIIS